MLLCQVDLRRTCLVGVKFRSCQNASWSPRFLRLKANSGLDLIWCIVSCMLCWLLLTIALFDFWFSLNAFVTASLPDSLFKFLSFVQWPLTFLSCILFIFLPYMTLQLLLCDYICSFIEESTLKQCHVTFSAVGSKAQEQ